MTQQDKGWLGSRFLSAIGRGFGKFLDWSFTAGPSVYQESQWKAPAIEHNDTPTEELIAMLADNADKVIQLREYYKIADALSWEIGKYFISQKDTNAFLYPFSSDLAEKARYGEIESWAKHNEKESHRSIYFIRVGDLLDHIAENPLPGDDWDVKTLEKKDVLFAGLQNRPLQIRKLMVLSAVLAEDHRSAMENTPEGYLHMTPKKAAEAGIRRESPAPQPSL